MKKIALITGATAGIGRATALLLAQNEFDLIITGRRNNMLEDLKREISDKYKAGVITLNFDIRKKEEVNQAIDALPGNWKKIDVLVNNAGLAAGLDYIDEGSVDDWETMIDTNIKGLLYITRKVSPVMAKNGYGHIVNISSIAGKEVYEKGNVYAASKHAVEALTKGMRIDLLRHNIKVSSVSPGAVETEFSMVRFKGDKDRADGVYKGYEPLKAEDIAEAVLFTLTRPAHVNINDILIMPSAQANATTFNKEN